MNAFEIAKERILFSWDVRENNCRNCKHFDSYFLDTEGLANECVYGDCNFFNIDDCTAWNYCADNWVKR